MTYATDLGKVVTRLQFERGELAFYIYTNKSGMIDNLTDRFEQTNEAINNMTTWTDIKIPGFDNEHEISLNQSSFMSRLEKFRSNIITEGNREHNVFEVILFNSQLDMMIYYFFL